MPRPRRTDGNVLGQRRQVGAAMRSYRKDAGMDREAAAALIGIAGPSLTRKENGDLQFNRAQIETLTAAYGVSKPEVAMLIDMAREGRSRVQRSQGEFPMFVPPKDRAFVELEQRDAIEILTVTLLVIPLYFQTEAYMRALWMRNGELLSTERINELVKFRRARQGIVGKRDGPKIRAVVHEAGLRLPVGGPQVMHQQLSALADACELPNVELHVQPNDGGAFPAIEASFILLQFADGTVTQLAGYQEGVYRDRTPNSHAYRDAWDRRRVAALDLQESKALILDLAAQFGSGRTL